MNIIHDAYIAAFQQAMIVTTTPTSPFRNLVSGYSLEPERPKMVRIKVPSTATENLLIDFTGSSSYTTNNGQYIMEPGETEDFYLDAEKFFLSVNTGPMTVYLIAFGGQLFSNE